MYKPLKETFEKITPLDNREWELIREKFRPLKAPAKQLLTSLGETETGIYKKHNSREPFKATWNTVLKSSKRILIFAKLFRPA